MKISLPLLLLSTSILSGCVGAASTVESRFTVARGLASSAGMTERVLSAGTFNLTSFARITAPNAAATVYIEGDGLAWLSRNQISMNPTPTNPIALRLAALDQSPNVIYIARPCQYTGWNRSGACPDMYWTSDRTAPEVIASFKNALNTLKTDYNITEYNLVGYSGGAGVAMLTAAGRPDIASIRTVAGNTDYAAFTAYHRVSPMSHDPIQVAAQLKTIPQMHFIGTEDVIVTPVVFNGWQQTSDNSTCVAAKMIPGVTHEKGWDTQWPQLVDIKPSCQ